MKRKIKNPGRGYAGKEKVKLYVYNEKGEFLRDYESCSELRKEYYPTDSVDSKRPLFNGKKWKKFNYDVLPNGDFYSNYRIGRDNLLKFERITNSPFCFNNVTNNKPVKVYNLLNEEIGYFKNPHVASLLTGISYGTIYESCEEGKRQPKKDLYFQYAV